MNYWQSKMITRALERGSRIVTLSPITVQTIDGITTTRLHAIVLGDDIDSSVQVSNQYALSKDMINRDIERYARDKAFADLGAKILDTAFLPRPAGPGD